MYYKTMGFFSIIETFFFISLGITIILVALLVYHFKQRLSSIENKYETLFDIISDVVKQLSNIQTANQRLVQNVGNAENIQLSAVQEHLGNVYSEYPRQTFYAIGEQDFYTSSKHDTNIQDTVDDIDDDLDTTSDIDVLDSEDDVSTSSTSEDNDMSDASSEDTNEYKTNIDYYKTVVSDDDITNHLTNTDDDVKVINLNVCENDINIGEQTNNSNLDENSYVDDICEVQTQDIQIEYSMLDNKDNEPILVKKIENMHIEQLDVNIEQDKISAKDLYKRMSLSNLKATVISKGLCSDPSKMKKNELLKLLEDE